MRKTTVTICAVAVFILGLTGCGTWINERHPDRNFQADYNQCWNDAADAYPKKSRYVGDEEECVTTYDSIWKREIVTCRTYPVYVDDNAQARQSAAERCIVYGGWTFDLLNFKNGVYFVPLWLAFSNAFE